MTELIHRLIKGGKIVGYLHIGSPCHPQMDNRLAVEYSLTPERRNQCSAIVFNEFELGIKLGEEWIFAGDIVQDGSDKNTGEIIYDSFCFLVLWHRAGAGYTELHLALRYSKVIGNIHEARDD